MRIPAKLHSLFWEYNINEIDTQQHAELIIGKVMVRGPALCARLMFCIQQKGTK